MVEPASRRSGMAERWHSTYGPAGQPRTHDVIGQILTGMRERVEMVGGSLSIESPSGNGERNRVLYVLKARGMAHSNQIREFLISNRGIDLVDAYIGASGVLTGSARVAQGDLEKAVVLANQQEAATLKREVERKRAALKQKISSLRSDYETEAAELRRIAEQVGTRTFVLGTERTASGILRQADIKVAAGTQSEPKPGRKI